MAVGEVCEMGELSYQTQRYLREVAARRDAAPHGRQGEAVAEAAKTLGKSISWVLGALKALGLARPRKPRSDRGATSVTEEAALAVAALVHVGTRAHGKRITSIKQAVAITNANGGCAVDKDTGEVRGALTPSTVSRALRRQQLHPDQLRQAHPVTPQRSPHPNHAWQIDVSRCVLFYLPRGGMQVMDEDKFYKNKLEAVLKVERDLVNRWVVVDKASGLFHHRYLPGGESAETAIEFAVEAMAKREGDVLHGVPFHLGMDAGLEAKRLFSDWIRRLGVNLVTHYKNPRANGSAESHQQVIETAFESRLKSLPGIGDFAALNRAADQWRRAFCASALHTRHGLTRDQAWLLIRGAELRTAEPDLLRALVAGADATPTVDSAYRISFCPTRGRPSRVYEVRELPGVVVGARVTVRWNPYRLPEVEVGVGQVDGSVQWTWLAPLELDRFGYVATDPVYGEQFKGQKKTEAERQRERVEQYAWGASGTPGIEKAKKAKVVPLAAAVDSMADVKATEIPTYLPRRGVELEAAADAAAGAAGGARLEQFTALQRLADALGDQWTGESYAWFVQRYPEGCTEDELASALARLQAGDAGEQDGTGRPRPAALRVVG